MPWSPFEFLRCMKFSYSKVISREFAELKDAPTFVRVLSFA